MRRYKRVLDGRGLYQRLERLRTLRPDMILFSGGVDQAEPGLFPIILMNGRRGAMDQQFWQIFRNHQGALVSVDAETQLRANVIRPRILILLTSPEEGMHP